MRLLLACAAVLAAAAGSAAAADVPVRATLTTSSTRAFVGVPWAYTIAVQGIADGPVDARVKLQVLRGGRVVRCWTGVALVPCSSAGSATWIAFRGSRRGAIVWPARLAGSRLTLHVLVATGTRSLSLDAPVNVRSEP
jgi:hypothetical protein